MTTDPWEIIGKVFPQPVKPTPPPRAPISYSTATATAGSRYAASALEQEAQRVIDCPPGGRNDALNRSAFNLGQLVAGGALQEDDVRDTLSHAARQAGLEDREISLTITSGLAAGAEQPRGIPEPDSAPFEPDVLADPVTGEVSKTPEQLAEQWHARQVALALRDLRIKHEAQTAFKGEQAAASFREPPSVLTLTEQLQQPRDPILFSIGELLPRGGNALLTAQFKAGKTTLITNLLRAYADNEPFLGRYPVQAHPGRIAVFNYELSQQLYDQWLEESGIVNTDRISVLHLRGYRMDLRAPSVEDWVVQWLTEHNISTWIADPFARAAVGVDENSNTEVGVWLDTFDIIKQRAGVIDGILPVHTGRAEQEQGQERARGATRLDDWADVRWILTKDSDDNRFFRATGRDVDVPEELLTFDPLTRALRIGGGDRGWVRKRSAEDRVVDAVRANQGQSGAEYHRVLGGKKDAVYSALHGAVRGRRLRIEPGPKNADLYFLTLTEQPS